MCIIHHMLIQKFFFQPRKVPNPALIYATIKHILNEK